jgi:hypothetical protein
MRNYENLILTQPTEERHDPYEYQQIVGSLMYIIVYTRLDLVFALGKLS